MVVHLTCNCQTNSDRTHLTVTNIRRIYFINIFGDKKMKKYSNILVALGVTLFLLTVGMKSEAEAQPCSIVVDTLILGGCPFEVELCVFCGNAYPGYVQVNKISPLSGCSTSLTMEQLIQTAVKKASSALWFDYCQYNAPPCSGPSRKSVIAKIPICWSAVLQYASLAEENRYIYIPCNTDEYCEVEFKYCVDSLGTLQSTINSITPNYPLDSTLTCFGSEAENIQLPVYPLPNGTMSDCFILHTPCNPDEFGWNAP